MESVKPILEFKKTCVSYTKQTMAVKYVSAAIERNTITAIMGPSGCGKSTLLRAVNLMHNLYPNIRVDGEILLNGEKYPLRWSLSMCVVVWVWSSSALRHSQR